MKYVELNIKPTCRADKCTLDANVTVDECKSQGKAVTCNNTVSSYWAIDCYYDKTFKEQITDIVTHVEVVTGMESATLAYILGGVLLFILLICSYCLIKKCRKTKEN